MLFRSRLLALSTVYGADNLNAACFELIKDGIIGIDNLERYLRIENIQRKNPNPMKFNKEKLNRIIPSTSLSSYDELLKTDQLQNKIKDEGDSGDGNG